MLAEIVGSASQAATQDWQWWWWVLIGAGAFIVTLAIILLMVLPKQVDEDDLYDYYDEDDYDEDDDLYGPPEDEFESDDVKINKVGRAKLISLALFGSRKEISKAVVNDDRFAEWGK
jgi:hypothetical protein